MGLCESPSEQEPYERQGEDHRMHGMPFWGDKTRGFYRNS